LNRQCCRQVHVTGVIAKAPIMTIKIGAAALGKLRGALGKDREVAVLALAAQVPGGAYYTKWIIAVDEDSTDELQAYYVGMNGRVIGSCLYMSIQFGRASAPRCPQRSHRSLGPNDGTGRSSG
jgi:hypothetical protein